MSLFVYIVDEDLREMTRNHLLNRRSTDSGFDILSPEHALFGFAGEMRLGIHCAALTESGAPAPFMLLARSSTSMTPLRLANQIGLADMGYRGEMIAKVDVHPGVTYKVPRGTRLFQLVQHNWMPWENIVLVNSLAELPPAPDSRGSGGFGSTGR